MRPSDTRVRQKKDRLQQARNARGKSWQDDLLAVLGGIPTGMGTALARRLGRPALRH